NGVLTLVFDAARAFDDATRAFLGELAAACGSALARGAVFSHASARANASEEARASCEARQRRSDGQFADRTHLYERERFARARAEAETLVAVHAADDLERVQPLTRALFSADSAREVIAALAEHGPGAFGAVSIEVTRRDDVVEADAPDEGAAEVLRNGVPLWLDPKDLARRFPNTAAALRARGAGSWLGVPVPADGAVEAVLTLAFPRERAFTPGDRARLTLLANECASVLARCTARDVNTGVQAVTGAAARCGDAYVVQYEEVGVAGPRTHLLGVFSSERSAREAVRELERTRSLVVHASITAWTVDVARSLTSVEIDP
ncbi:MAG TPA: GAF domain-containing protein, partial [Anaeromyxobacteraceae bacterium]|nr:GAF domain-containing protein [Anaeromyxobacteraceae bacterium]